MKKLKTAMLILFLFFVACWVFFPWNAVQSYVTMRAFKVAANNGIFVSVKDFGAHGIFDTEFVYNGVRADFPLMHFNTDSMSVNPRMISVLTGKYALDVSFDKGCLELVTKQKLPWSGGCLEISADKETLFVRDIAISGAFSARGFVEVSRANGRISRAQLIMRVPQEAESAFVFLSKGALPGLSKDMSGSWRLVR